MFITWLKKHLPSRADLANSKSLGWMRKWLNKRPYLWKFTKHSVAGGVAASLLVAFIPLPLQMILAALLAIIFRVNLPVAVIATWISNPITFIPANFLIYKVGELIVKNSGSSLPHVQNFQIHWNNMSKTVADLIPWLQSIGKAYLVGFPIVSIGAAILGYIIVFSAWTVYEIIFHRKKS